MIFLSDRTCPCGDLRCEVYAGPHLPAASPGVLWRADVYQTMAPAAVHFERFVVIGETPHFWKIANGRLVKKSARKAFARLDPAEALNDLRHRTNRRVALSRASYRAALDAAHCLGMEVP